MKHENIRGAQPGSLLIMNGTVKLLEVVFDTTPRKNIFSQR